MTSLSFRNPNEASFESVDLQFVRRMLRILTPSAILDERIGILDEIAVARRHEH